MRSKNKIVGLRLESCRFSRSSISLELEGKNSDKYVRFFLSTSYDVSFDKRDVFGNPAKDCEEYRDISSKVWEYLELTLDDIVVSEDERVCELIFTDEKSIYIWSQDADHDNLLVVRRWKSENWFVIA